MLDFLKTILRYRDKHMTFLLIRQDKPHEPSSFEFKPKLLIALIVTVAVLINLVLSAGVYYSPLSGYILTSHDQQLRVQALQLSSTLTALKDSLDKRDLQLRNIKEVLVAGKDTTFDVRTVTLPDYYSMDERSGKSSTDWFSGLSEEVKVVNQNEIIYSSVLRRKPSFPSPRPASGLLTRGFQPDNGHYGIDIAAQVGSLVKAIDDGAVIYTDWTMNYGYVIHVQHGDGYISIYKHCSNLVKKEGDIILKGDILGTVGQSGAISSGPHVHFELWRDGIALNPQLYLSDN